jgi:glycosyltransferase involved in cell wall biosynthesis
MPVLNGERFIGEAIESIVAQTYPHYELIVIDDGSTDSTAERVAAFRGKLELQYVRHSERRGIAPSMNDGVRHATGDLIAFLDHDDAWFPEFLRTQVTHLEEHPEVGMVHSDFQTIDVDGNVMEESVAAARQRKRPSGWVFRELFLDSFIVGNSVLIRKECFARLGMFDESLRWGDYHMWMRIARHYRVDYVNKVLTKYRQHPTQSTRSTARVSRPDADSVGLQSIQKILQSYPEIRRELGPSTIRRRISFLYFDMGYAWSCKAAFENARVCLRQAIRTWPLDHRYYMHYAATLMRPSYSMMARRMWRRARLPFSRA